MNKVELLTRMTKIYPTNKDLNNSPFLKINSGYKELFVLNPLVIRNICNMLQWHLKLVNRSNEDNKFIHFLLLTCRNLLAIRDAPGSGNLTANEKLKIHFDLINQFCNENLIGLFITIASDKNEAIWHILIFEIFYHILEHNQSEDLFTDHKMVYKLYLNYIIIEIDKFLLINLNMISLGSIIQRDQINGTSEK